MLKTQYRYTGQEWKVWHDAERVVHELVEQFLDTNAFAFDFAERLMQETSCALYDFIDHIVVSGDATILSRLSDVGFIPEVSQEPTLCIFLPESVTMRHRNAHLPRIVVDFGDEMKEMYEGQPPKDYISLYCKCDSLRKCMDALPIDAKSIIGVSGWLHGEARLGPKQKNFCDLYIVERKAGSSMKPPTTMLYPKMDKQTMIDVVQQPKHFWQDRKREFADDAEGMEATLERARSLTRKAAANSNLAAHLAMEVEREYWESRNKAAQIQKARQDTFGLGWANHDHHTFRSSREHFKTLIHIFETLGFECRERFYAGEEAGWGAQVLENPIAGLVIFADVDLSPEEVDIDFAHEGLEPRDELGTIGLWCGLHGESILQAGMHHLEISCSFEKFREDFPSIGHDILEPFNDTGVLKQAFTTGERWQVRRGRLDALLKKGLITKEQYDTFARDGAIGSHLEHLERRGGFKGFMSKGVSKIIQATDPRKN